MEKTTTLRTSVKASVAANVLLARINKLRVKAKKDELSKSQLISLAIHNFKIEDGAEAEVTHY